ncbi:unnamed protein product [Nyctereutes procyonoides]|uniref:(raccoon dog) hypothetical protein n=1 Tax=Nyctereutes procyonoides TaxID=34880 RepID=A0A811Z4W3_NYCPR|nr:unnamed protein product [Nyctereutes procyonoides]
MLCIHIYLVTASLCLARSPSSDSPSFYSLPLVDYMNLALGFSSFISNMEETYMNSPDPRGYYNVCSLGQNLSHISSCDDKSCIEQNVVNQTMNLGQEILAKSTRHTPLIWGIANYCGNNSPENNIVMECKSNLASVMCIPESLLYVLPWKNHGNAQ